MTRPVELLAIGAVSLLAIATSLSAAAVPRPAAGSGGDATSLTLVRDGCGQGRYRNQYGHCRWIQNDRGPYNNYYMNDYGSGYAPDGTWMGGGGSNGGSMGHGGMGGGMGGGGGGGGMGGHGR